MSSATPSSTAQLIARSIVFLDADRDVAPLLPPRAAEVSCWFLEGLGLLKSTRALTRPPFRWVVSLLERHLLPGIFLHYVLRKRWLEDAVRDAVHEGFKQVVVLGAGFDTLAVRLQNEFPQVRFIEVDHPDTQAAKRATLESRAQVGSNMTLAGADLSSDSLRLRFATDPDFWPAADTMFVAEGVLMYLDERAVRRLFADIGGLATGRLRIAFSYMEAQGDTVRFPDSSRLIDWWLNRRGEIMRWGIAPEHLAEFVAELGYRLRQTANHDVLRDRYLPNGLLQRRLARGERLALIDRE